jgi:hypothetical protein
MKTGGIGPYEPILTALKKAGLKVGNLEHQGKKTVITVSPMVQNIESRSKSEKKPSRLSMKKSCR